MDAVLAERKTHSGVDFGDRKWTAVVDGDHIASDKYNVALRLWWLLTSRMNNWGHAVFADDGEMGRAIYGDSLTSSGQRRNLKRHLVKFEKGGLIAPGWTFLCVQMNIGIVQRGAGRGSVHDECTEPVHVNIRRISWAGAVSTETQPVSTETRSMSTETQPVSTETRSTPSDQARSPLEVIEASEASEDNNEGLANSQPDDQDHSENSRHDPWVTSSSGQGSTAKNAVSPPASRDLAVTGDSSNRKDDTSPGQGNTNHPAKGQTNSPPDDCPQCEGKGRYLDNNWNETKCECPAGDNWIPGETAPAVEPEAAIPSVPESPWGFDSDSWTEAVPDDDDDVPFWRRAARDPRQAQTEPSARNDISDQYIASEVSELDPDDVESDYVPSFTHSG